MQNQNGFHSKYSINDVAIAIDDTAQYFIQVHDEMRDIHDEYFRLRMLSNDGEQNALGMFRLDSRMLEISNLVVTFSTHHFKIMLIPSEFAVLSSPSHLDRATIGVIALEVQEIYGAYMEHEAAIGQIYNDFMKALLVVSFQIGIELMRQCYRSIVENVQLVNPENDRTFERKVSSNRVRGRKSDETLEKLDPLAHFNSFHSIFSTVPLYEVSSNQLFGGPQ